MISKRNFRIFWPNGKHPKSSESQKIKGMDQYNRYFFEEGEIEMYIKSVTVSAFINCITLFPLGSYTVAFKHAQCYSETSIKVAGERIRHQYAFM